MNAWMERIRAVLMLTVLTLKEALHALAWKVLSVMERHAGVRCYKLLRIDCTIILDIKGTACRSLL